MSKQSTVSLTALALAALLSAATSAQAVTVNSAKLQTIPANSSSHTYTGLDGVGTTMTVSQGAGSNMDPISGTWPGLWLGSNQESDTYTFTFNKGVSFIELYITAQSTAPGLFSEIFNAFTTSAPSTASFTSEANSAWDGSNLTSSAGDGRSRIRFTSVGLAGFSSLSFRHLQTGAPNGSVVQEVQYDVAAIPEPETYGLMLAGLAMVGWVARRRRG